VDALTGAVSAAQCGDREAFAAIVAATHAGAYALAHRLTGDEHDARDVVQEAYLRAYRALPGFRGDAQVTTWLYRIVANCAARHQTRRRRHRHTPLDDAGPVIDEAAADPAAVAAQLDLRRDLEAAIAALAPRLRQVLVLRDVYDLSHDQIAAELGITVGAGKVRLHRARKALREQLFPPREVGRAV
jgi:RNA polymerase sigma-70 factor, ECF subfamily